MHGVTVRKTCVVDNNLCVDSVDVAAGADGLNFGHFLFQVYSVIHLLFLVKHLWYSKQKYHVEWIMCFSEMIWLKNQV